MVRRWIVVMDLRIVVRTLLIELSYVHSLIEKTPQNSGDEFHVDCVAIRKGRAF
jgi:hypothetical protein